MNQSKNNKISWACWSIPLFIDEVFIQGRKINNK